MIKLTLSAVSKFQDLDYIWLFLKTRERERERGITLFGLRSPIWWEKKRTSRLISRSWRSLIGIWWNWNSNNMVMRRVLHTWKSLLPTCFNHSSEILPTISPAETEEWRLFKDEATLEPEYVSEGIKLAFESQLSVLQSHLQLITDKGTAMYNSKRRYQCWVAFQNSKSYQLLLLCNCSWF